MNDIYKKLYTREEIYRPPIERDSILLEVGYGCSYGKCGFCDFIKDSFFIFSNSEIKEKISLLPRIAGDRNRLFCMGCNILCLPVSRLIFFMDEIRRKLPMVSQISMYARADDIIKKGAANLQLLRKSGLTDLHVGVESGSDTVLALHTKGETRNDMLAAFALLDDAGISYHISLIPGLGGEKYSTEHAEETASLLSLIQPKTIWNMGLKIWDGTPLEDMVENGSFAPLTYAQMLREERYMLSLAEMKSPCLYVDSTALGKYTIRAFLPMQKEILLAAIDKILSEEDID